MRIFSLFVLTGLCLLSCTSQESKITHVAAEHPDQRRIKLTSIGEELREAEQAMREKGIVRSDKGRSYLAVLKEKATHDQDPHVRATALRILGGSCLFQDRAFLLEALHDPSWRCQYEALRALRRKKTPRAVDPLIALLKKSDQLLIRLEAMHLLRELHASKAIPVFYQAVVNLLERNRTGTVAWLGLKELSGKQFSSSDFISWKRWYETTYLPAAEEISGGTGNKTK